MEFSPSQTHPDAIPQETRMGINRDLHASDNRLLKHPTSLRYSLIQPGGYDPSGYGTHTLSVSFSNLIAKLQRA